MVNKVNLSSCAKPNTVNFEHLAKRATTKSPKRFFTSVPGEKNKPGQKVRDNWEKTFLTNGVINPDNLIADYKLRVMGWGGGMGCL